MIGYQSNATPECEELLTLDQCDQGCTLHSTTHLLYKIPHLFHQSKREMKDILIRLFREKNTSLYHRFFELIKEKYEKIHADLADHGICDRCNRVGFHNIAILLSSLKVSKIPVKFFYGTTADSDNIDVAIGDKSVFIVCLDRVANDGDAWEDESVTSVIRYIDCKRNTILEYLKVLGGSVQVGGPHLEQADQHAVSFTVCKKRKRESRKFIFCSNGDCATIFNSDVCKTSENEIGEKDRQARITKVEQLIGQSEPFNLGGMMMVRTCTRFILVCRSRIQ